MNNDSEKIKCNTCGNEYYLTNPKGGCPYCNNLIGNTESGSDVNVISKIFKSIAWFILLVGFLVPFILSSIIDNIVFIIAIWICYALLMLGFYAVGEIIQILHDIRFLLRKERKLKNE